MRKFSIGIQMTILVLLFSGFCFADGEWRGIIPGALGWNVDSIVEQWTQTSEIDSESFEQVHWTVDGDEYGEHDFIPVEQRYNRQLVITLAFVNLGSDAYHFDYSSRLELLIMKGDKAIRVDAIPTSNKTVIVPNGRIKKCSFLFKMNNRAFTEAFDHRGAIGDLLINPTNGKLLIEDSKGNSLLDNVEASGVLNIITPYRTSTAYIFPQLGKAYTVNDILNAMNSFSVSMGNNSDKPSNKEDFFTIQNGSLEKVLGVPIAVDEKSNTIVLFSFNNTPVDNDKTSDLLQQPFHSKDKFQIGFIPAYLLKTYIPSVYYDRLLIDEFKDNISQLPESIAPKKYQEVNNAGSIKKSYLKLKEFAESGDDEAIDAIGRNYNPEDKLFKDGFLFKKLEDAFQWFKNLADKGYSQAQLATGLYYENGQGVKENLSKSLKYYKMAADQENDEAMVCYANVLRRKDSKNFDESMKWYRKAAKLGNARGQYLLAIELLFSKDDSKLEEGIEWLKKSADKGYPAAIYRLGMQYLYGVGVPKDEKKAFSLIDNAARLKYDLAYNILGYLYLHGIGVERNEKMAAICYGYGALEGVPESMYWYGRFLCDGYNVKKDVALGYRLIKDAAVNGYNEAEYYIGFDYYIGHFAKKNDKEAFFWLEKAANDGYSSAMSVLGDLYIFGRGVKADRAKAIELYKQSADKEDPHGLFRWGQYLYQQNGANAQMGLNYINAAAKRGNKPAQKYLEKLDGLKDQFDENEDDETTDEPDGDSFNEDIVNIIGIDNPFEENDHEDVDNDSDDDIDDLDEEEFLDDNSDNVEALDEEDEFQDNEDSFA
ncbi:MAG: SEL1-like repeat protein [Thermoguttaceae bacterium]|nr:SEL1-like repeat protein [Thermoguttaceae bacterium]